MSATAGDLCTTIIGDLGRGDTSLSDVVLIDIQSAIREYENTRFYFNEILLNATLSAVETYSLSLFQAFGYNIVDIIEVDNFDVIINASRKYRLQELNPRDFLEISANSGGTSGYPQFFTLWNQSVKIFPVANSPYNSDLWAHVKFTEIATGGFSTSNAWTTDGSDLIRNAALKRLWGRRFRNMEAAAAAAEAERIALRALQRRTNALSSNSISPYL